MQLEDGDGISLTSFTDKKEQNKNQNTKKKPTHHKKKNHKKEKKAKEGGEFEIDLRTSAKILPKISQQHAKHTETNIPLSPDDYLCYTAKTALLLPFKWADPTQGRMKSWMNDLKERKILHKGKMANVWEESFNLPDAVADLHSHFRQTLGWDESRLLGKTDKALDDVCRQLIVTDKAKELLFPKTALVAINSGEGAPHVERWSQIEDVSMIIFPLGTAVLVFRLNWNPTGGQELTLEQLRTWLFLSKFRQKVPNVFAGWVLDINKVKSDFTDDERKYLSKKVAKAIHYRKAISLTNLGNWLLSLPGEDINFPVPRLQRFLKRCYHHTVVVIDRKPSPTLLKEYLFHLRRAYGQKNRPPPQQTGEERPSSDCYIRPRMNRYIGMSREGTISISWPIQEKNIEDWEVTNWHTSFLGIYLILTIHVCGEKSVLLELANLSAQAGKILQLMDSTTHFQSPDSSLMEIVKLRRDLFSLAVLMTRYTLQMASDDCGGLSDYVEYFSSLRKIFGIKKQRDELREEIQDVLALVESSYLEEQRKFSELEKYMDQEEKKANRQRQKIKETQQRRFERIATVTTIMFLPVVVVSGIFGMNLNDLDLTIPTIPLLAGTFASSLLILILFIIQVTLERKNEKKIAEPQIPDFLHPGGMIQELDAARRLSLTLGRVDVDLDDDDELTNRRRLRL